MLFPLLYKYISLGEYRKETPLNTHRNRALNKHLTLRQLVFLKRQEGTVGSSRFRFHTNTSLHTRKVHVLVLLHFCHVISVWGGQNCSFKTSGELPSCALLDYEFSEDHSHIQSSSTIERQTTEQALSQLTAICYSHVYQPGLQVHPTSKITILWEKPLFSVI